METVRKQTRTQADPVEGELAAINALGNTLSLIHISEPTRH